MKPDIGDLVKILKLRHIGPNPLAWMPWLNTFGVIIGHKLSGAYVVKIFHDAPEPSGIDFDTSHLWIDDFIVIIKRFDMLMQGTMDET